MNEKPKSKRYGFNKPGEGPGFDYWWNADEVPDDIPRYKGELEIFSGSWGNPSRRVRPIPDGGFAVEGPKRYTNYKGEPANYGDWTVFGPGGGRAVDIIPWCLIFAAKVEELPKKIPWYKDPNRKGCQAGTDGDCFWDYCPQLRDGEPEKSGRHCPLDTRSEDDEEET